MTTPSGGLVGDATIRVRADTDPALRAIRSLSSAAGSALRGIGGAAGSAALSLGGIGATAGAGIPALAAVAAAVQSIAPAATAAATGFLAIQQASAVVQLGMIGVEDAISAAFETGEGSAQAFEESLQGLAPEARNVAVAVREMSGDLREFQQSIQNTLFQNFDAALSRLASTVLPDVQAGLTETATTLNTMALGAAEAAAQLSENGTLGQALDGANQGLRNLEEVPSEVVTAFGQLAAAGAPAFDRLTDVAAGAASGIAESLSNAFESGRLQESVGTAVDLLFELGGIAADAFGVLQNVLGAVSVEGGDLFQVLGTIIGALEEFTGTEAFQEAIGALAETMGQLASSAAPLLISALQAIAPIFTNLAGPVQGLIQSLASGLEPIIEALGPVLDAASQSLGILVSALSPILPIIGNLIAQLGPILTPILESFGRNVQLIAPLVLQLVTVLANALSPILAALPQILLPIQEAFTELLVAILPLLNAVIVALTPVLNEMSTSFIDLLIALEPVITSLLLLATDVLVALTPLLIPLINLVVRLSSVFSGQLTETLNRVVIPALNSVAALLRGDFSGALSGARQAVTGFISSTVGRFLSLPNQLFNALARLGGVLVDRFASAFRSAGRTILTGIRIVAAFIGSIPSIARNALGDVGDVLFGAGQALIRGFINGIRSLIGAVTDAVSGIIDTVGGFFPESPAKEGPFSGRGYVLFRGQKLSEDFARGILDSRAAVRRATESLVSAAALGTATPDGFGTVTAPIALAALPGTPLTAPAAPVTVSLTVVNQGVLGSRVEVLDWLTGALDELRRQQRLGVTL